MATSLDHIRAGRLRALGVTTATRFDMLPEVPTIAEFVSGFEASSMNGIGVPKRTATEIVTRLNIEINAALPDPRIKARIAELGLTPLVVSPTGLEQLIADETDKWAQVIRSANIKANERALTADIHGARAAALSGLEPGMKVWIAR
jgi:tripartite-type tricarboxylate transporter receptor subunit TctC